MFDICVICPVKLAVGFAADFANRFFGTGRLAAYMPVIIDLIVAVAAVMPMMRLIMLPIRQNVVTFRLYRLGFGCTAFVAGICFFSCRSTGGRNGNFARVPIVRLFAVYCVAAGAFIPMFVLVMLLHGKIVTESLNSTAALCADDGGRTIRIFSRMSAVVANCPNCRQSGIFKHWLCKIELRPTTEDIPCLDGLDSRRFSFLTMKNALCIYFAAAVGVKGQITEGSVMNNSFTECNFAVIYTAENLAVFKVYFGRFGKLTVIYITAVKINSSVIFTVLDTTFLIRQLGATPQNRNLTCFGEYAAVDNTIRTCAIGISVVYHRSAESAVLNNTADIVYFACFGKCAAVNP